MNITTNRTKRSPYVNNVSMLFYAVRYLQLSHAAIHLHAMILSLMNERRWPERIEMSDRMMAEQLGMVTRTLVAARQELIDAHILICCTVGSGNRTQCAYSLVPRAVYLEKHGRGGAGYYDVENSDSVMSKGIAEPNSPLKGILYSSYKINKENKEGEIKDMAVHEIPRHLWQKKGWADNFCQCNGISHEKLKRHLLQFTRHLMNQGFTSKPMEDVERHFGAWFDHMACQNFQKQEQQLDAQERARRNEEESRMLEKERRAADEQRMRERFERMCEEMRRRAAEGDEEAIEWLKRYGQA